MSSKKLSAIVISATLLASPVLASETGSTPLPAGKAAGTHEAALLSLGPIFWIGLAAIAIGVGVAASNNGKTTTATSTGTSS